MSTVVCAKLASLGSFCLAAKLIEFAKNHQDVANWVIESVAKPADDEEEDGEQVESRDDKFGGKLFMLFKKRQWCVNNVLYMVGAGHGDQASRYTIERRREVTDWNHRRLAILAGAFANDSYPLAATIIYRVLVESTLKRGHPKAYAKGCDYLITLKVTEKAVRDWQGVEEHRDFAARMRKDYRSRRGFWKTYWKKLGIEVDEGLLA